MSNKRKILFTGDTITIVQHQSPNYLEMIFYGYTKKEEFQQAWIKLYEIIQKGTFNSLLLDQKYMHIQPESFDWFKEKFISQASPLAQSLKVAVVSAVNFLGEYQVKQDANYLLSICAKIKIQFFEEFDLAEHWMEKQI
jgi:hypothetical protein